jgi:glycosyltransferase involved in cell wall biosynthesis
VNGSAEVTRKHEGCAAGLEWFIAMHGAHDLIRPKRAIHVVPSISNEASGPSYSVVRLCQSLIAHGEDITLATLDVPTVTSPPPFLRTFRLGMGPLRLGRSPPMKRWLASRSQSHSVDLLHNHSLWMMPNVYPGLVAKRYGIPLVVSPRGTLSEWAIQSGSALKRAFWPLLQKPALAATSCFHATSPSEYEDIRRLGFRQPVAVIPNGIDVPDLPPKSFRTVRTLLFLGRIHRTKGLDVLLPAWQRVQDKFPAWHLRIVGPDDGGYLADIQRLSGELRLERIEFSGALYGPQKWLAYREADLFVLPTHSENFGMSIAESLAAGTPAIVSKGAPWAGLKVHQAGWWIDIGIEPLVACLGEVLNRIPESLSEVGVRGRAWMEADFSWAQIGRRMGETYYWLLNVGDKPDCLIES